MRQRRTGGRSLVVLGAVVLTAWAGALALLWPAHGALLAWDEVDYATAAGLGTWANAVERGSLSPAEFVAFAYAKLSGTEPRLPPAYDEARDPLLLRHYHPPLVVLLLSLGPSSRGERSLRAVQLLGAMALTLATVCAYRSLAIPAGWAGTTLVGVLTLSMIPALYAAISFHGWEAVWTTTTAALLSRWLWHRTPAVDILLCASLALALLTLETGVVVWVAAVLCVGIWRGPASEHGAGRIPWRPVALGALLTGLLVVAVWPGSVLTASLVKIPALYAYRIRVGEEYAGVLPRLPSLLRALLPTVVLGPFAGLWLLTRSRTDLRRWGPFVVVGGLYGIALARFALAPQYLLPALAPLVVVVGAAGDRLPRRWAATLVAAAGLTAAVAGWPASPPGPTARDDLDWLRQRLAGRHALADGGHIYQYYLGPAYRIRPVTVAYRDAGVTVRVAGRYRALERKDIEGAVVLIQKARGGFFGSPSESVLLGSCTRISRPTVMVYDCAGTRAGA